MLVLLPVGVARGGVVTASTARVEGGAAGTLVLVAVLDLHVRVVNHRTGQLLRELTLDQPGITNNRPNLARPAHYP